METCRKQRQDNSYLLYMGKWQHSVIFTSRVHITLQSESEEDSISLQTESLKGYETVDEHHMAEKDAEYVNGKLVPSSIGIGLV